MSTDALLNRYRTSSRRGSALQIETNPLENSDIDAEHDSKLSNIAKPTEIRIENLSDARQITDRELSDLLKLLQKCR